MGLKKMASSKFAICVKAVVREIKLYNLHHICLVARDTDFIRESVIATSPNIANKSYELRVVFMA
jgi:hypothetical protein